MAKQHYNDQLLNTIGSYRDDIKSAEWRKMMIEMEIPQNLNKLKELALNLWHTWNYDALELFRMIDSEAWEASHYNPVKMLESLTFNQLSELADNKRFNEKLEEVYARFSAYMNPEASWPENPIVYLSMEYGLSDNIMIYSGGLGMLAGDFLKEASDNDINMIGIGLLYRYGYFTQRISLFGDQIAEYKYQEFNKIPVRPAYDHQGNLLKIQIPLEDRMLDAKVWRLDIGKVCLYLFDTDIQENSEEDKILTHQLYGGGNDERIRQEILLGMGGNKLMQQLGIQPSLFHCNEGHAAFVGLDRFRSYVQDQRIDPDEAMEMIRSTTLFTTHTPVPAGHDTFPEDLMKAYFGKFAEELGIGWENFIALGRINRDDPEEDFSMSHLAMRFAQETNGVSKLHGKVSRDMFKELYPGFFPEELHIGHVTNGVHYQTWTAPQWQQLYAKEFSKNFLLDQSNPEQWRKIHQVPDKKIAEVRSALKKELIDYLKDRLKKDLTRRQEDPNLIVNTIESIKENAFIVGFARRFATYKRGNLLFQDPERLTQLVNMQDKPVIFLFAGKAHPRDEAGQGVIRNIIEMSKRPEFLGKIIFIENYNIEVAKKLVQGVDLWFNTPTRLMEASGTSGQKAILNGVLNFSVLDGWWSEGYKENAGWALSEERTYEDQEAQNKLDAEMIYSKFENEIIPLYFKAEKEINTDWIRMIKNSIAEIAPEFTLKRMMEDYINHYYTKMLTRSESLALDHYRKVKELVAWKKKMIQHWDDIEIISAEIPDTETHPYKLGEDFVVSVTLKLNGIQEDDIGLELIFRQTDEASRNSIMRREELQKSGEQDDQVTYTTSLLIDKAGTYDYAIRMFPNNPDLPHRQDFALIKWL